MNSIDYNVIRSGSKGNAVRIENIMIDCGVPFKEMREDLYKVDTLLITHRHGDHINPQTFNKIREQFPRIRTIANADVAYSFNIDTVIGTMPFILKKNRKIIPYYGKHDVPVSYFIIQMKKLNILYATDTNDVENPDNYPLDYCFLESNYDEIKLRELGKAYKRRGYDPTISNLRHFSSQKCKEFYYVNRRDKDSVLIELHKSTRFY